MLGKLAGFIAQPVPGFDYSKDPLTPIERLSSTILVVNLTKSAFQCIAIGLVVISWCEHHPDQFENDKAPQSLKDALWNKLSLGDTIEFEEIALSWKHVQTDASDLLATLKYHNVKILQVIYYNKIFCILKTFFLYNM